MPFTLDQNLREAHSCSFQPYFLVPPPARKALLFPSARNELQWLCKALYRYQTTVLQYLVHEADVVQMQKRLTKGTDTICIRSI